MDSKKIEIRVFWKYYWERTLRQETQPNKYVMWKTMKYLKVMQRNSDSSASRKATRALTTNLAPGDKWSSMVMLFAQPLNN
jgi:hypothetical protein